MGRLFLDKWYAEPRSEPDLGNPTVRDRREACGNMSLKAICAVFLSRHPHVRFREGQGFLESGKAPVYSTKNIFCKFQGDQLCRPGDFQRHPAFLELIYFYNICLFEHVLSLSYWFFLWNIVLLNSLGPLKKSLYPASLPVQREEPSVKWGLSLTFQDSQSVKLQKDSVF